MTARIQYPPSVTRQSRVSAVLVWLPHALWSAASGAVACAFAVAGAPGSITALFVLIALAVPAYIAVHELRRTRANTAFLLAREARLAQAEGLVRDAELAETNEVTK
ncbi:hypothetical protein [Amycolatopsis sp. PS_44_ISF1]|uniref:hypothetical protein n=1 Tax=Amycolatopsis sp. PS_44_ISF1 TaxID=2974917 RepID=UPI0028DEB3AE|nr:hypothetical protein [Amycolatopsis sp. PS_44_ISF1]MDT8916237.1 hypothetical protein [Amycolatopsis sp. PS_44_ISF1]